MTETLNPTEIAAEVTGQWLTQAYANRRDDLLLLIEDVEDHDGSLWCEHLDIAAEMGVPEDALEFGDPVHDAIIEAANDTASELPQHLLAILLDELGERIWDLALPNRVRTMAMEIARGLTYPSRDAQILVLATVLDEHARYVHSTV